MAKKSDVANPALDQFRKLWNGGEHRRAIDEASAAGLSPEEWAVLHGEFPEILDVING